MSGRIRGDLEEGVTVEGRDPGADMPNTVSEAMWRPRIARSPLIERRITIAGIEGSCYGSARYRCPVNRGASNLKWQMSP